MVWAFIRFGLLIAAAIPLALRQAMVWENPPEQLVIGCFLTIAFVGAIEPFVARIRDKRKRLADEQLERIRQVMLMALSDISDIASLGCQDLGVHLFVPKHRFPRGLREPTLERLLRVRLSSVPVPSEVNWIRGKGIVGSCWLQERDVGMDLHGLHSLHYGCDEAHWAKVPEAVRMGMTYQDFQRTQGKHGWVLATPITRSVGGVVGIISVDGPCGSSSALDTGRVRAALRRLADDVERHLDR